MKIRAGFVSNSSSSSFTVLGTMFKEVDFSVQEIKEILNRFDIKYRYEDFPDDVSFKLFFSQKLCDGKFGFDCVPSLYTKKTKYIIGKILSQFDDGDLQDEFINEIKPDEYREIVNDTQNKLDKFFNRKVEMSILYGVLSS